MEVHALTAIRGLAASWVVLFHLWGIITGFFPALLAASPLMEVGYVAVPLFFVLSGYLLGSRYASTLSSSRALARYFWLRLGRIYPVHLGSLFLTVLLVTRNGWPSDPRYSVESLAANILMVHAWQPRFSTSWNSPSWSISSEWFAYLMFPVLVAALGRCGPSSLRWLSPGTAAMAAALFAFRGDLPFFGLTSTMPSFIGGVVLARLSPPGSGTARDTRVAVVCVFAAAALPFVAHARTVQEAVFIMLSFAIVRSVGAAGHTGPAWWRQRWMLRCGEISYSLYMTHGIAISFIASAIPLLGVSAAGAPVRMAYLAASLVFITGVAALMYHVVERPARAYSRRAGPGRNPSRTLDPSSGFRLPESRTPKTGGS